MIQQVLNNMTRQIKCWPQASIYKDQEVLPSIKQSLGKSYLSVQEKLDKPPVVFGAQCLKSEGYREIDL